MTALEILTAFELEINKIDDTANKPITDDSLHWLNKAILKFTSESFAGVPDAATRYTVIRGKQSFEQSEAARMPLIKLVRTKKYEPSVSTTNVDYDEYNVRFPDDFMYELSENVQISDLNGNNKTETTAFECTYDTFMYRINNSLTDFHYNRHKARPIRLRTAKGCTLMTDKQYKIKTYTLSYIRLPYKLDLDHTNMQYDDFEDHVMHEIIKLAATMYIGSITGANTSSAEQK